MFLPDNNPGMSITQLLTSALAFLVSIITAILGWIVKGAGERMEKLEEQQKRLEEKTEEDIKEISERRAQSESKLQVAHFAAIEELSKRMQMLEIQVDRGTIADVNLTKSVDKLGEKMEKILGELAASRQHRRGY